MIWQMVVGDTMVWSSVISSLEQLVLIVIFSFEPRLGNEDAHNLARISLYLGQGRHMWVMHPHDPDVIPQTVIFDE